MEDYEQFVRLCLSKLRKGDKYEQEHNKPPPSTSLIRFYGRSILPPLLSEKQREEMKHHRDEAQKVAIHKNIREDPRMAYVQTLLQGVQLRNTPTLEELLQEDEIQRGLTNRHHASGEAGPLSEVFPGTEEVLSPTTDVPLKNIVSLPRMTSTTYSAFFGSNAAQQKNDWDRCLTNQHKMSQPCSFNAPSHQSQSSGYVTNENVENTASISAAIESDEYCPSEEEYIVDGFFLHNTSNTIARMPDIISHPPIDGEELERDGSELSFCRNLMGDEIICDTSFQDDSVITEHAHTEKPHSSMKPGEDISVMCDSINNVNEGLVAVSDRPESSQTQSAPHCPTMDQQVQQNAAETEPMDCQQEKIDSARSEELYPRSLQALLKKSQEYRRCRRMLRNQAKNPKVQERIQVTPKAGAEERSLSDKENDGAVTVPVKKTRERRNTFVSSVGTSIQKLPGNVKGNESEVVWKRNNLHSENRFAAGDTNDKEFNVEESILKNNLLNSFQEVTAKPQTGLSTLIRQQPKSPSTWPAKHSFHKNTKLTGAGKYRTFPPPTFCLSPVHSKNTITGITSEQKRADSEETKQELSHPYSHKLLPSSEDVVVDEEGTGALAKSSEHIDQLESNLSSLKTLILDLESTVKENLDNYCQTGSNVQTESSFISVRQSEEIENDQAAQLGQNGDSDCWGAERRDAECREWLRKHSFSNFENINARLGPGSNLTRTESVSWSDHEKETEMEKISEIRPDGTSATQSEAEKATDTEGLSQSSLQSGSTRHAPGKALMSVAQQMRIPTVFRNSASDNRTTCNPTGLSNTSHHPVERQSEMGVEGHSSVLLPSLNQSYDVDMPSGLWLLGSGARLEFQKSHFTPNNEGEDQKGKLQVKRRLIMQTTEETQQGDTGPMIRANSTSMRGQCYEGDYSQQEKQEKLKQAHAAQLKALQNEHKRQQEELLKALAGRYSLLQNLSFTRSKSSSHLGETSTFSTHNQALCPLSQRYRTLLAAAAKGFLTRRLLKTERVAQLVRTVKDTQQFLQTLRQQSASDEELCSRQDFLLLKRVTLQLRAARYDVYDIFFSLSAKEQMQLISLDRDLTREREHRRQKDQTDHPGKKSSLSAATQKALERKREKLIQKKTTRKSRAVVTRTGQKNKLSANNPQEMKGGQFKPNPQRVPIRTSLSKT